MKKKVVLSIILMLIGIGVWYLKTMNGEESLSSSVLTTQFNCSEDALRKQTRVYRQKIANQKKMTDVRKKLESEIGILKKNDPKNQLQKTQNTLKVLVRKMADNNRFITKYNTCRKEIKLVPDIGSGIMSAEARVVVSDKEYQALAAFNVTSPKGLNMYIQSLQFQVINIPAASVIVDKWLLLHEGANPLPCYPIISDPNLIECELGGNIPIDVREGMSRNYAIGAHITNTQGSGTLDIQMTKIRLENGRVISPLSMTSKPLQFGILTETRSDSAKRDITNIRFVDQKKQETTTSSSPGPSVVDVPSLQPETANIASDIPAPTIQVENIPETTVLNESVIVLPATTETPTTQSSVVENVPATTEAPTPSV